MLGNLQTEWARLLIDGLVAGGVKHAVLSPGSRSTPFVWAALEHRRVECHSIIDERSAGFFALGLAKVSGEPVLLVCTSGSAGAHYLPALVEAKHTGTPLVVLTADRPFRLMKRGASQTIDQTRLFGTFVNEFFELGGAEPTRPALEALRQTAVQAVFASGRPRGGPVHVNARADKPLEPMAAQTREERDLERLVNELIEAPPARAMASLSEPNDRDFADLLRRMESARRGLIVCGGTELVDCQRVGAIAALAKRTGFGVLAELQSQLGIFRTCEHRFRSLSSFSTLHSLAADDGADFVLELGAPLVSRHYEAFCKRLASKRHVVSSQDWSDAAAAAGSVWQMDPLRLAEKLSRELGEPDQELALVRQSWLARLAQVASELEATIASVLESAPFGEAHAAREIAGALPEDSLLVVGNSLPIRALNAFAESRARAIPMLSQRGASGIDGLVAGAAGAAQSGRKTTLVLGDVSLAHDIGSLQLVRSRDVCIVLIDNQGGQIFGQLPWGLADNAPERKTYWVTPPGIDFEAACSAFGIGFASARSATELRQALREAHGDVGPHLVRVVVAPDSYRQVVAQVELELGTP